MVDAIGRLIQGRVSAGQAHDITQAGALLDGVPAKCVVADEAYDAMALRQQIADMTAKAVIPPRVNRARPSTVTATSSNASSVESSTSGASPHATTSSPSASSRSSAGFQVILREDGSITLGENAPSNRFVRGWFSLREWLADLLGPSERVERRAAIVARLLLSSRRLVASLVLLCHKSSFARALPQQGHCPRRAISA